MSFWGSVGSSIAPALGKALGGGAAAFGLGKLFGPSEGSQKRAARKERNFYANQSRELMTLGNEQDLANQKAMFDFRMSRARGAGLTNVEAFGSPASGAGGGTTGSGAMLGNMASTQEASMRQARVAQSENEKDRQAQIVQTAMQTESQQKVAETQAGGTVESATISAETNERIAIMVNKLNTRELEEVALKRVANETGVAAAQVKKLLNEARFTPEFKREITKMTMGVSNSVNMMLQKRFGVDVTSEADMQRLSDEQMKNVLHVFMAADSRLYTEIAGILGAASGEKDFNLDPIGEVTGEPPKILGQPSRGTLPSHIPRRGYH